MYPSNYTSFLCSQTKVQNYDLGLHIGAIFIIIAVSLLGVLLPLVGRFSKRLALNRHVILYGRMFGIGVVLATGFVHLIPPAVTHLTSPCLPEIWNTTYTAFAGAFALGGAMLVQLIEYVVHMIRMSCIPDDIISILL
eukprot:Colp12_sorted_trinity150504_noHs@15976